MQLAALEAVDAGARRRLGSPVEVRISTDGQPDAIGEVTIVSHQLADVWFSGDQRPVLPVGAGARLALEGPRDGNEVTGPATIVGREDRGDSRLYRVRIPQSGERGGALAVALHSLFNRRATFRVRPPSGSRILVHVRTPDGAHEFESYLADISLGGLAVVAGVEVDQVLASLTHVRVRCVLPLATESVEADACIVSRVQRGQRVRYGMNFSVPVENQREVNTYVMRRQRERLRPPSEED